jgi:hypothetical protein
MSSNITEISSHQILYKYNKHLQSRPHRKKTGRNKYRKTDCQQQQFRHIHLKQIQLRKKKQNEEKTAKKADGPDLLIVGRKQDWPRNCSRTQMLK